jgi:hypothetical protein
MGLPVPPPTIRGRDTRRGAPPCRSRVPKERAAAAVGKRASVLPAPLPSPCCCCFVFVLPCPGECEGGSRARSSSSPTPPPPDRWGVAAAAGLDAGQLLLGLSTASTANRVGRFVVEFVSTWCAAPLPRTASSSLYDLLFCLELNRHAPGPPAGDSPEPTVFGTFESVTF